MRESSNSENKSNALSSGMVMTIATVLLIFVINYLPQNGARNVASLVAGMFGFTAVQALRKSFDG
ncbi:hypothetical protein IQ259_18480 [Fortiea sp. LEGE XX443]|uniref:hypothetical protein n=1 Tax=Fortiea sp. LEGE XX443 TaxID=1828611 RepID=UPI001882C9BA|nr:hypothetical protein [Fortiea sp. LEGE XX443]MBE9006999.1 hypothetical protein [Fortiea sp. LEGE XX443]